MFQESAVVVVSDSHPETYKATSPSPGAVTPPADGYYPGAIRRQSDAERERMALFLERHPEYAQLAPEVVLQAAETFLAPEDHAERQLLRHEGVPADWTPEPELSDDILTSDDR